MRLLPPAILLAGPTASGKTALALGAAARFPIEIVSVDSAQVFIDMDIGSAKPDAETLDRVPHHLIDLITPEQRYSVANFRADALRAMAEITARGNIPLLTGGTMLYFKALREGLADLPQADAALRARIDAEAAEHGWPALHAELARSDPATATRLKPNDAQRIQRAIEVTRLSGRPLGDFFAEQAARSPAALPYRLLPLALFPSDRAWLHQRIAQRFDEMLAAGLVGEVEGLQAKYRLDTDLPSMRSVGYRQVWEMLEGRLPATAMRDRGVFATRQFAKRQITWLRSMPDMELIDCLDARLDAGIFNRIEAFLAAPATPSPA
ncbi:MAG: tRNA (adenosine(37)-N6)-dimethylallyltransferase MiaA [Gammaproteobacteria bacterium]|nr:tRNA (adenosine(37)-N6)-dimethylallyltransferase MiaA [Gammaproteobacteria bacterium]MBU1646220.1 tRNA (adenosine(37)-N6)-dimethylallyltransferase MiaA [Gammaproteobacteria bacterium]MBU1972282.1 tRNA (adenosine(37)-N6)-dimethylallyltransferase MiaA [Gammaproteobacteria bacterium]